jgi:putative transposase
VFKGAGFDFVLGESSIMRNRLQRFYGRGDLHFITFSCRERLPLLGNPGARNIFVSMLDEVRAQYGFRLLGFVVMPEHVHMVVGEPKIGNPSDAMVSLKERVSFRLNPSREKDSVETGRSRSSEEDPYAFWQRRFYDFNVWSSGKLEQKLDYMHRNPVVRGLVSHPKYWPWSSWSYYEKGEVGLIRIDGLYEGEQEESQSQRPHP